MILRPDSKRQSLSAPSLHLSRLPRGLRDSGQGDLLKDLEAALSKDWIGSKGKPGSPASTVAKLGYDLFLTKGFKPGYFESLIEIVQRDGTKELLKLVGAVLLAAVLFWLGLKEGANKEGVRNQRPNSTATSAPSR